MPPTFADSSRSQQSHTREGRTTLASHRAIFAIHRCRRAAAAPTTHTREACRGTCSPSRCQRRGFVGSSRREEALKKPSAIGSAHGNLPSPPREHEESPGKRSSLGANACLQANAAAAVSATPSHLSQHHRLVFWGLGRSLRPSFGHGAQVWKPR